MYNIKETLAEFNLTSEEYEKLLKDCSDKVHKLNELDWSEIANKYNIDWNGDSLRKGNVNLVGGAFVKQYYEEKYAKSNSIDSDSYMKELQIMKDEIYKEKRKLYDQRREYNKNLISDARAEHLTDELIMAANKLNEDKPLTFIDKVFPINLKKEAVLCWSDWHYGMITNNIWNTYNTEICKERVTKLVSITKEYLKLNKIDVLNIVMLGDAAHGGIHSSCRIQSEEDVCDQLMHVSEIMAEAISDLSCCEGINEVRVYSCYGNHMRTIQDKNDSIHSDNMEKIIPWWLKQRLHNNSKVAIFESEYKEFTKIDVLGYKMIAMHGDLENFKNIGTVVNTIFSRKFGETIDYTISGDKHHLEEFEQFDIESILIRSLCGTDDYANNKRLYSKAGQTLMIFNNQYGRESTYHIPLN